jgi:redox-sensing transcriptional repressor
MILEKTKITKAILGRLPQYQAYLREIYEDGVTVVSATKIAIDLSLGEVQVRKDLNAVCGKGKPKRGYNTVDLLKSVDTCLGQLDITPAVLVGAGRLGKALLEYTEFEKYGIKIVAAFDCNREPIRLHNTIEVLPIAGFGEFCKNNKVEVGIITVGEGSAQTVCDQMTSSGIRAIWNFAPCKLKVPEGVILLQENLALSLAYLNNCLLKSKEQGEQQ